MPTPSSSQTLELLTDSSPNRPSLPILINFLNTVPTPLTTVLIGLAPYISKFRQLAEIVSWRSSPLDSWLALGAWWGVCLLAEPGLRYFLPITLLFLWAVNKWTTDPQFISPPVSEHHIETIVSDLVTINALIPSSLILPATPIGILLRVAALLYPLYLLLTYLVRLRVLVGITGTLLLSWRAPWARTIRYNLRQSAWVRWSVYHAWSALAGQPLPPLTQSFQPTSTSLQPVNEIRFLFTIYENQRWWMTLDWTPALLPAERPSWCSHTQHAVSPPSAFALPEQTSVVLPDGKGGRIKRTATWRWEESEWRILVKNEGGRVRRVEIPQPNLESPPKGKFAKTASKTKEPANTAPVASGSGSNTHVNEKDEKEEAPIAEYPDPTSEEHATDADGWVYCDNKWENSSNNNGLGKFTRYRRWARVAVVSETVIAIEDEGVGIQRLSNSTMPEGESTMQSPTSPTSRGATADTNPGDSPVTTETGEAEKDSKKRATLRQRMQNSLHKSSASAGAIS